MSNNDKVDVDGSCLPEPRPNDLEERIKATLRNKSYNEIILDLAMRIDRIEQALFKEPKQ